ncbi:tRNA (cytosine(72)-C(5))-methyltransferase NSUN6 isoform X1 [Danio aesculapii]|uniref:tRNA (cytosine(72)-C(5))-methyltransferase NSUN6 isoform X1 n=1 Tax=Danio aesculapii TaxID=1142201 RepID=UPI0024BFE0C9|nr:tRNA (cytosine(72)-C(5))-methyltransferase NSUN6 isoform X1 [Danio aesculapii]XP_056318425.1 tRNA (cytosine(72)-C(5))-methyltransferase NSUN6 isoform X1 [Danio aesculapii]XP_056318426.1 tRNA (cytosine(72)-C(5))-methyltransferase NSUN6 isoform X1 [Danio aesculapii]XP_056318427.1 tRNA (cytosine(72)-C(5))-methyltransferase NSUN6 isoform X1 [Danio aesculapii]
MAVFPQLSMNPEVREHLHKVYTNAEVVSELGADVAEQQFEALLWCLSHPPLYTCLRVSTHLCPLRDVQQRLQQHLEQTQSRCPAVHTHPELPDVLLLPVCGPRPVEPVASAVIVGSQCGSAVLRGAHVFTPGIISTHKYMKAGDVVSVFSDVEGKCTRGATEFNGKKVFVGNGVSEVNRSELFSSDKPGRGLAIRMTEPLYQSPSFDGVLTDELFLQNLPSVVVGHVLGPRPGERVLDMCAAPGGKTTHIASLMGNQGVVVALEKVRSKMEKILQNAQMLKLDCIKAYCCNSINAVSSDPAQGYTEAPPFLEESFDRILLDAPCSGLGQRPNMSYSWSLKEVCSYQPLQRKLFTTAVRLLKSGGVLVYSTCTVTLAENEEQVSWALKTFPCLTLQPQVPHVGSEGMLGAGLSCEQRRLLQRFRPELCWTGESFTHSPEKLLQDANKDTIGFFIAKFSKR